LLDATWFLPNSPFACPVEGSSAAAEFAKGPRLPGACFFDLDAVADTSGHGLPHMLPSGETLGKALASMGVSHESEIVVYDQLGIFSAPRLWFTLKAFGHESVAVLDGGLPAWQKEGLEVEEGPESQAPEAVPEESWTLSKHMVWDLQRVMDNVRTQEAKVLDARPAPRFSGSAPEPRPGMRGGHMPGSLSVPFGLLLSAGSMKEPAELRDVLSTAGVLLQAPTECEEWKPPFLVTSCGSGMTACIVGLALKRAGFPIETNWAVYDGSWIEYGGRSDTEIVKIGPNGIEAVPPLAEEKAPRL